MFEKLCRNLICNLCVPFPSTLSTTCNASIKPLCGRILEKWWSVNKVNRDFETQDLSGCSVYSGLLYLTFLVCQLFLEKLRFTTPFICLQAYDTPHFPHLPCGVTLSFGLDFSPACFVGGCEHQSSNCINISVLLCRLWQVRLFWAKTQCNCNLVAMGWSRQKFV